MSSITISDLQVTGLILFEDPESYLQEISDAELGVVNGGSTPLCIFAAASSPECVTFVASLIVGATAGISAVTKL